MTDISLDRGTLRVRLDIDLRLLAIVAFFAAFLAAEVAVMWLVAPAFDAGAPVTVT